MTFTLQVLAGLVLGLVLGIAASVSGAGWLTVLPPAAEPVGMLFINAIRMTVIPLIAASLMLGVASLRDARLVGRVGIRAIVIFLVGITAAAAFATVVGFPVFARLEVDPAMAASLRAGVTSVNIAEQAARTRSIGVWGSEILRKRIESLKREWAEERQE